MITPDNNALGHSSALIDPVRYDGHIDAPWEVAGMLRDLMPSGVRVLDVGCGTGSVTRIANADKGNQVMAVEPDENRVHLARARGIEVHQGYLNQAFIDQQGKFDVILCSDVLEHMQAPLDVLGLFRDALKPGGCILISVPNVAHWSIRFNLLIGRFDYEEFGIMDATHLRWYTAKSIRHLVEAAGFSGLRVQQTAGVTLPVYTRGSLARVPRRALHPAIRAATKFRPNLFGVQHVIKAVRAI